MPEYLKLLHSLKTKMQRCVPIYKWNTELHIVVGL